MLIGNVDSKMTNACSIHVVFARMVREWCERIMADESARYSMPGTKRARFTFLYIFQIALNTVSRCLIVACCDVRLVCRSYTFIQHLKYVS